MPINIPDDAFAAMLQWTRTFSEKLPQGQQIEMRGRTLQFLSQGVQPQAPPFSLEDAAEGRLADDGGRVGPFALLQAFAHYARLKDAHNMMLASEMLWQLIGSLQQQSSN